MTRTLDCGPARRSFLTMAAMAPVLAAATADGSAPGELPADLAGAVDEYEQAALRSDTALLARIVADDYLLVNSDSTVQDKQSYLADFDAPGFRLETFSTREPMRKVWGDAALTGGILNLAWTQGGERQSRVLRIVHVWTKRGGRWRLAYTQLTRVPQ